MNKDLFYIDGYYLDEYQIECVKTNNNLLVIIVLVTSIIGIIPLFMYKDKDDKKISYNIKSIDKRKILFFIIEQSKVIFLSPNKTSLELSTISLDDSLLLILKNSFMRLFSDDICQN